jgi:hypothetical protein
MTIGFSPFITADVDETFSHGAQWSPATGGTEGNDTLPIRLELIRRRVLVGYYASPRVATELARRIVQSDSLSEY